MGMLAYLFVAMFAVSASAEVVFVSVSSWDKPHFVVDERFISFNFDWHMAWEGANWGDHGILKLDLEHEDFNFLTRQLSPAFLRVGGTEGNIAWYDVPNTPPPPPDANLTFTLNASRWDALNAFALRNGLHIMFGVAPLLGRQHPYGNLINPTTFRITEPWDTRNVAAMLAYTADLARRGGSAVAGYEMGNELCPAYESAVQAAGDAVTLRRLMRAAAPGAPWALVAPDCNYNRTVENVTANAAWFTEFLDEAARRGADLDVMTWHAYGDKGNTPGLLEDVLSGSYEDHLHVEQDAIAKVTAGRGSLQTWVGETAAAWDSGRDGVTNTFADGFWWIPWLGGSARRHTSAVCRQTLVGGWYELLNTDTKPWTPSVDFFVAVLWKRLMGTRVLLTNAEAPLLSVGDTTFTAFAHCAKDARGVTLAFANKRQSHVDIDVSALRRGGGSLQQVEMYVFTADRSLQSRTALLNGTPLIYKTGSKIMPSMHAEKRHGDGDSVHVPALSYGFIQLPDVSVPACL